MHFSTPFDKQTLLGNFWADTFSKKSIDFVKANLYLERFSQDFQFSSCEVTTSMSISRYLKRVRDSKTGPNGIPNSAYFVAGPPAHAVLANTSNWAQCGHHFSFDFNDCEAMFPPKGKRPDDYLSVARSPVETRPLKCKNHDNNILAGERNFAISKHIKKYASDIQNGFISGRIFLCNVIFVGLLLFSEQLSSI